jgi:hypothetical protein
MRKRFYLLCTLIIILTVTINFLACIPDEKGKKSMQGSGDGQNNVGIQGGTHAGNPDEPGGGSHVGNPIGLTLREFKGKLLLGGAGGCRANQLSIRCPFGKSVMTDVAEDGSFSTFLEIGHACTVDLFYKDQMTSPITFSDSSFVYIAAGETVIDLRDITCTEGEEEQTPHQAVPEVSPPVYSPDEDEFVGQYYVVEDTSVFGPSCPSKHDIWNIELFKESPTEILINVHYWSMNGWSKTLFKGTQQSEGEYLVTSEAQVPWPAEGVACKVLGYKSAQGQRSLSLACFDSGEAEGSEAICHFDNFHRRAFHPMFNDAKKEVQESLDPNKKAQTNKADFNAPKAIDAEKVETQDKPTGMPHPSFLN